MGQPLKARGNATTMLFLFAYEGVYMQSEGATALREGPQKGIDIPT